MKIAVLGARGRTGSLIATELRARGHEVLSVVRRADDTVPEPLAVADGRDAAALAAVLADSAAAPIDAVVFAIGPRADEADPTVMRESMAATLEAMKGSSVSRLVVVTADGPFRTSGDPISRFVAKPIVGRLLASAFDDLRATDALVQASGLEWTVIRPPQLHGGASRRARRRVGRSIPFGIRVSRVAVAVAVADAVGDAGTRRQAITVAT